MNSIHVSLTLQIMSNDSKCASIYKLDWHIIEKICQYLIDDGVKLIGCFNCGVKSVLNLRATCRLMNERIKYSRIRLYLNFEHLKASEYENSLNLLKLMDAEFSWIVRGLEFEVTSATDLSDTIRNLPRNYYNLFKYRTISSVVATMVYVELWDKFCELIKDLMPYMRMKVTVCPVFEEITNFDWSKFPLKNQKVVTRLEVADNLEFDDQDLKTIVDELPNVETLFLEMEVPLPNCVRYWKNLRTLSLDTISVSEFRSTKTPAFPNVYDLLINDQQSNDVSKLPDFILKEFPNLRCLTLLYSGRALSHVPVDIKYDVAPSCRGLRIQYKSLPAFMHCKQLTELMIYFKTNIKNDPWSLDPFTEEQIKAFQFQSKIFAFRCYEPIDLNHYLNITALRLLQHQVELEVLTLDFWRHNKEFNKLRSLRNRKKDLPSDFWNGVKRWVQRNKTFLMSHPTLKMFRFKNKFIMLKDSVTQEVISTIDDLDMHCLWTIRTEDKEADDFDGCGCAVPLTYDSFTLR